MGSVKFNFEGKIALVTASTRGIGFAIAKLLAESGASVGICSRTTDSVKSAEEELKAATNQSRIFGLAGDIGSESFLKNLIEETKKKFGRSPDILVNNSGGPPPLEISKLTDEQWREALDRNLMSVVRLCNLTLPGMMERKYGRIVNLTSMIAKEPEKGMALSAVARAGVAAFTKTLSREFGSYNIVANTILTGGVMTDRFRKLVENGLASSGETFEQAVKRISTGVPVGHVSTPEEFAKIVGFFISEEASFLTGTAVPIDGGAGRGVF